MKVIGAIGLNGSGKDELINYLHHRCGLVKLSLGDVVREIAAEEGLAPTRENLHAVSRKCFAQHGQDVFVNRLIRKIEASQWPAVGITSVRTPTDVQRLRQHFKDDFLLVQIEVTDPAIRYGRSKRRHEARDPQTAAEFLRQDQAEREMFQLDDSLRQADLIINNDDSLAAFHQRVEETVVSRLVQEGLCGQTSAG